MKDREQRKVEKVEDGRGVDSEIKNEWRSKKLSKRK